MNTGELKDEKGVIFPDPKKDYHGHPDYGKTLIYLLLLFGVSLVAGYFVSPLLAVIIIFATAVWKTALVMRNFMHLKYEPFLVLLAVFVVLFVLLSFFWGVFPDITMIPLELAK